MRITIVLTASLVLVAGSCRGHGDEGERAERSDAMAVEAEAERDEAPKYSLADAIRVAAARADGFTVVAAGMTEDEEGSYTIALLSHGRVQEVIVDAAGGNVTETRERSVREGMGAFADKVEQALPSAKVDFARAVEIARARTAHGRIFGAQVDFEGDVLVYGITLVDGETVMDVTVDAASGEVVGVRERTGDEDGEQMEDESAEGDEPMDESHESSEESREKPEHH